MLFRSKNAANLEDWKMTKEQINIAIAESQGWKFIASHDIRGKAVPDCWTHENFPTVWADYPRDYCNDLNAMHEVELGLSTMYRQCYIDNLVILIFGEQAQVDGSYEEQGATLNATALQRAEAYLRTIGKWNEKD